MHLSLQCALSVPIYVFFIYLFYECPEWNLHLWLTL